MPSPARTPVCDPATAPAAPGAALAVPAPTPAASAATRAAVPDAAFARELNELLVGTFRSIERYEEQSIRSFQGLDLSVNEAHVIEVVGRGTSQAAGQPQGLMVTQVAAALGVKTPTATAAVNRLVAKGLLVKERNAGDARSINVRLTHEGRRAFRLHELFHRRMTDAIAGDMTAEERRVLVRGIRKLRAFFENAANGDANDPQVVQNSVTSSTACGADARDAGMAEAPLGYPYPTCAAVGTTDNLKG